LQVGGHADSDGSASYNKKLSERRAKAVLKYLMGKGISDQRLKYNAYGEKYPMSDNSTEAGKQRNRRAEIKVTR
jgi:outer membrane protein OmpA-like peptidoglycan-associated protein